MEHLGLDIWETNHYQWRLQAGKLIYNRRIFQPHLIAGGEGHGKILDSEPLNGTIPYATESRKPFENPDHGNSIQRSSSEGDSQALTEHHIPSGNLTKLWKMDHFKVIYLFK